MTTEVRFWRVEEWVAQSEVHRIQARGAAIAKISRLHRRGLAGEESEPIAIGMQGEVDEDIDPVIFDNLSRLRVRHSQDVSETARVCADALGESVCAGGVRIAEGLETVGIVLA